MNSTKIKPHGSAFTYIESEHLDIIKRMLTIEKENWRYDYLIRIGRASKDVEFFRDHKDGIIIQTGHMDLPHIRELLNLEDIEFNIDPKISEKVLDIIQNGDGVSGPLPFIPRDYQISATMEALTKKTCMSIMCTGSGKSLTISLALEFFRREGLKGALIVPNINLLTQFRSDIKSYNLMQVYQGIQKAGNGDKARALSEDKFVLITTWQSLMNLDVEILEGLDFIICDEVHRFSSECTSKLVLGSLGAKYKLGFTGTLPAAKTQKMTVLGLFGMPNYIISSNELIKLGLGTAIVIHGIKLMHRALESQAISKYSEYIDRVKFLIQIKERNTLIATLAKKLKDKNQGSTLILYTLIEHGELIYKEITNEEIRGGKDCLERQKELGIFFMTGKTKAKDREYMRNAMEENPEAILIANYSLLSTGVNIKSLRYAIFASPLKSYTAIVQSLGRGIRVADDKELFEVYDIADHFSGISTFDNSFKARKKIYEGQKFEFSEKKIKM